MTNPKNLTKNMPKLQPAKQIVTSPNNNSRHRLVAPSQPPPPPVIPQQMTSPSNLPRIMPKLKPLLPNQGSAKLLCSHFSCFYRYFRGFYFKMIKNFTEYAKKIIKQFVKIKNSLTLKFSNNLKVLHHLRN